MILLLLALVCLFFSSPVFGADRVDFFDTTGRRTGYAIVDQTTGRVDFYDAQSRRTGYGTIGPSGIVDRFDLRGRRQGRALVPDPLKPQGGPAR